MRSRIIFLVVGWTLGVGGFAAWNRFRGQHDAAAVVEIASESTSDRGTVQLAAKKRDAAGIQVAEVTKQSIAPTSTVPGRLQYDDTRHVEVKVPTEGILVEIHVKPGDKVQAGQELARLSSPEVGTARADVLKRQAEAALADREFAYKKATCDGVDRLVAAVRKGQAPEDIGDEIQGETLGEYRETILAAYSRHRLAESLSSDLVQLTSTGAISGRIAQQRRSETDSALAALETELEQASYQADKECVAAQAALNDADRRLEISQQHLNTLLGYQDQALADRDPADLSLVSVQAPFAGTIESKGYSVSERVQQGASLFVLADTSTLWAAADIRERDWPALQLQEGQTLTLTTPATGERTFAATVYYVGREVDPHSNAVPLVARVQNEQGLLRPGQFVRVEFPTCEATTALVVPDTAIVEHDDQAFVFTVDGEDEYQRRNVELGIRQSDSVEILAGLSPGEKIVVAGTFYLKSELLLEAEDE